MAKRKKELSKAEMHRFFQRLHDAEGGVWTLRLILDGYEEVHIANLAEFKRRHNLTADVRRKVIAAARAALVDTGIAVYGK